MGFGLRAYEIDAEGDPGPGDLQLTSSGNLASARDGDEVRERVLQRWRYWRGTNPKDESAGIDMLTYLQRPQQEEVLFSRVLIEEALKIDGVVSVTNLELIINRSDNTVAITAQITTQFDIGTVTA